MVSLISVHDRGSLSDVYGLLHFSLMPVGFTSQYICAPTMNRDQGYHLPAIYNQIIPPKSEATHVTSVREQGPYLTDRNVVLVSTKMLQSK